MLWTQEGKGRREELEKRQQEHWAAHEREERQITYEGSDNEREEGWPAKK